MWVHLLEHLIVVFLSKLLSVSRFLTKRVIGRGQEARGLYILDPQLSKPIACYRIASPHEVHCRLGHQALSLLKKLFPQFSSPSSLNCESCQPNPWWQT